MEKEVEKAVTSETDLQVSFENVLSENGLNDLKAQEQARKDGFVTEPPTDGVISEETAKTILNTPFSVAAAFMGDFWLLSKEELDLMAPPAARVFSDIFGRWAGQYPDIYMLGFALIVAIAPRAAKTVQLKKETKEPQPEETENGKGVISWPS